MANKKNIITSEQSLFNELSQLIEQSQQQVVTQVNTVTKLLVDVGAACQKFHDEKVIGVKTERVQADEIWSFIYAKDKNATQEQKERGAGDAWTWTAIDADVNLLFHGM